MASSSLLIAKNNLVLEHLLMCWENTKHNCIKGIIAQIVNYFFHIVTLILPGDHHIPILKGFTGAILHLLVAARSILI